MVQFLVIDFPQNIVVAITTSSVHFAGIKHHCIAICYLLLVLILLCILYGILSGKNTLLFCLINW